MQILPFRAGPPYDPGWRSSRRTFVAALSTRSPPMNIATRFLATLAVLALATSANAAPIHYVTSLSGPSEGNASPGVGTATLDLDTATHQWTHHVDFSGLTGTTTASHTHAATVAAGTG